MEIIICIGLVVAFIFWVSKNQEKQVQKEAADLASAMEGFNPSFKNQDGNLIILHDKVKEILRVKYVGEDSSMYDIENVYMSNIEKGDENTPFSWMITNEKDNSRIYIVPENKSYFLIKDFTPSRFFSDPFSYLAIDMKNEKILSIMWDFQTGRKFNVLKFSDIRRVELTENGQVISSKSTARTIGGAIVGNAVAGGAGLILGGLSGDSKQKEKVNKIIIRIITNNIEMTQVEYELYLGQVSKDDIKYKNAIRKAQEIENIIGLIIDKCDESKEVHKEYQESLSNSIIEDLKKLSDMKDSGILTEEEFNKAKNKILNS